MHHRPSHFLAQLQSAPKDYLSTTPEIQHQAPVYEPVYYFFYGTLTQPETLKRILDLKEESVLRQVQIIGYSLAKWGDYLTLLDGPPGNVISGHTYMVQSSEDE
jgi:Gamma-glutamyl cyclotransferase, AIG2-like